MKIAVWIAAAVVWLVIVTILTLRGNVWGVMAMRVALLAPIFLAILVTLYRAKPIK